VVITIIDRLSNRETIQSIEDKMMEDHIIRLYRVYIKSAKIVFIVKAVTRTMMKITRNRFCTRAVGLP